MNIDIINFFQLHLIVKIFLIVLAVFYLVFTVVVHRQISLMTQVLDSRISPSVKSIAVVQIGVAAVILLLTIVIG